MYRQDCLLYVQDHKQAGSTTLQHCSSREVLRNIRKSVQNAAIKQEKLARSREELMVKRQKLRALNKKVQDKRIEAGDAEAAFMDKLRQFMNENLENVFLLVAELYDEVQETRNDLGALESDLFEAERMLSGADWRFTEEETNFYQYDLPELFEEDIEITSTNSPLGPPTSRQTLSSLALPPPPPPPFTTITHPVPIQLGSVDLSPPLLSLPLPLVSPESQLQSCSTLKSTSLLPFRSLTRKPKTCAKDHATKTVELDGLGRQFGPFDYVEINTLDEQIGANRLENRSPTRRSITPLSLDHSTASYSQVFSSSQCSEFDTEHTEGENKHTHPHELSSGRQCSDSVKPENESPTAPWILERLLSEETIFHLDSEPTIKDQIWEWLWISLRKNVIEQTLYRNILEDTLEDYGFQYPIEESWQEPATQYWGRDSSGSFETDERDASTISMGTSGNARSEEAAEAFSLELAQHISQRTNAAATRNEPKVVYMDTGYEPEEELDDPSDFPLPRSLTPSINVSVHSEYSGTNPQSPKQILSPNEPKTATIHSQDD